MLKALNRWIRGKAAAAAFVPEGAVAWAVGDVHGRADLLGPLLMHVLADLEQARPRRPILVFLGDYVDRGFHSKDVIELLIALSRRDDIESYFLLGNHDQTMLAFLSDPAAGADWFEYGGRETLASYGVTPPIVRDPEAWEKTRQAFAEVIPETHVEFLRQLGLSFELGDYFFSHAGARPGVPLDAQSEQDLLWIRQPFLQDDRRFEKVVVHGHSPAEEAHSDHRRVGLDTGAYATGVLSAVRLERDGRQLVQSRKRAGRACEVVQVEF